MINKINNKEIINKLHFLILKLYNIQV